jgi:hypothetical protein
MTRSFGSRTPSLTWSQWGSILMAAITTSYQYQNSSQDLFGNVKIPSLDSLPSITNDWRTVVNYNRSINYSSLLRIPIRGIPANGTISFNLTSRYFAIQCKSSKHLSSFPRDDSPFANTSSGPGPGFWAYELGGSCVLQLGFTMRSPESNSSETYNETVIPFNITTMNWGNPLEDLSFVECSMEPQDVESSVRCVDRFCKVTAMKKLPLDFGSILTTVEMRTLGDKPSSILNHFLIDSWAVDLLCSKVHQ